MSFQNKLILITGGSSGIGLAAAKELAKGGAKIIIQARSVDKLEAASKEIESIGAKVHFYATELTNLDSTEKSALQIMEEVGIPDVIINCAGSGEWLSLREASLSHYKDTMESPYLSTAYTCKVFYDKMLERGSGQFIMVNSPACFFTFPGATGYMAARWALFGFVKSLQADLFHSNIKVSMIVFGKVDSPYFANNPISEERIPKIMALIMPTLKLDYCGRRIAKTIKSKKSLVVRPIMLDICVRLNRIFPRLFRWVIRVVG